MFRFSLVIAFFAVPLIMNRYNPFISKWVVYAITLLAMAFIGISHEFIIKSSSSSMEVVLSCFALVLWLFVSIGSWIVTSRKGLFGFGYFLLTLLLGPLGLIASLMAKPSARHSGKSDSNQRSEIETTEISSATSPNNDDTPFYGIENATPVNLAAIIRQPVINHLYMMDQTIGHPIVSRDMNYARSQVEQIVMAAVGKFEQSFFDGKGHSIGIAKPGYGNINISCWPCTLPDLKQHFEQRVGHTYNEQFPHYMEETLRHGCQFYLHLFLCLKEHKLGVTACYCDAKLEFLLKPTELVNAS